MIPQEQHPDINFVGLLIGPRGNTLKNLEKEVRLFSHIKIIGYTLTGVAIPIISKKIIKPGVSSLSLI